MNTAGALEDFRASEVAFSVLVALTVLVGAGLAMRVVALDRPASVREIDRGTAIPVRIVPVLDLDAPLLKLGGKRDPSRLPDRWARQTPKPRVEQRSFVSAKARPTRRSPRWSTRRSSRQSTPGRRPTWLRLGTPMA